MASDEESARPLTLLGLEKGQGDSVRAECESQCDSQSHVPHFWRFFAWLPRVRPLFLLWFVLLGWVAVLAGGLVGIVLGGESACAARTATALNQYGYVAERIQEKVTLRTLPVVSLATFIRQTPYFPELALHFDSIASDLLKKESAVANIQLVPGGVVSAAYPPGNEGAIGHDLFADPNRRADVLRAVVGAPSMSISNPVVLTREGQSGRAIFARYPVFIDGPIANRTEAFGVRDAHECGDLCYGDPDNVFWGLSTALVDFDELLVSSGLTTLEEEGACFVLRTGRVFKATDLVSTNSTIFQSNCVASRPEVLTVQVPNDQWFLEIGTPGPCTPWVIPLVIVFSFVMLGLLMLLLLFVHQSQANRVLTELRHAAEVGQLRERQQQLAREEASLGSDAVRLLVTSLSKIQTALTPMICQTQMEASVHGNSSIMRAPSGLEPNSMMSIANLHKSLGKGAIIVTSKVYELAAMQATNAKACAAMLTALHDLVQDHVGEYHGECVVLDEEKYVFRFKEIVQAVSFALKLRKVLLESTWPEQILSLPGCGPKHMAMSLQADAKGPQLQTIIDLENVPDGEERRVVLCNAALPRQILMTADAWMQLANTHKLAAAGFPDVDHLGTVLVPPDGVAHVLFEANDPSWDFRLPQLPRQQHCPAFKQLLPAPDNVWDLPAGASNDGGRSNALAVVALKLQHPNTALLGEQTPSMALQRKLQDAVKSMRLLFGGYTVTPPSTWHDGQPTVVVFPNSDCAISFSACLQLALLHVPWSEEELATWGAREVGLLGKLSFAGPRIKCVIDLQQWEAFSSDEEGAATAESCLPLLDAAHGGQVLVTAAAMALATVLMTKADKLGMVDLGEHCLRKGSEPVGLKELKLVDVVRHFPPLRSFKEMSPGFYSSPDPAHACGFVYCQAVCLAGTRVSSRPSYAAALATWKQLSSDIAAPLAGYETHSKGSALAYAFPSLEAAISFAIGMQRMLLEMPLPDELASHDAFKEKLGENGQTLFKGLPVKVGISYGVPVMRRPIRATGRASYHGNVVQQGARTMLAACPGQVLLAGADAVAQLGVPVESLEATLVDKKQEPMVVSSKLLADAGCPELYVRALGYFKQEGENSSLALLDVVPPELSERTFSLPPGRVGAAVVTAAPTEGGSGEHTRGRTERRVGEASLATILSNILDERVTYKAAGSEEKVQVCGILGQGMQGKVMLGKWKGVDVAYKVVHLPVAMSRHDKAQTRALLEMAISATMAHPHVVQTYSYDMVYVEPSAENNLAASDRTGAETAELMSTAQAHLEEPDVTATIMEGAASGNSHDVDDAAEGALAAVRAGHHEARLIQELCDRKTLRFNLDKRRLVAPGDEFPHVGLALQLAHDIACGLQHIHSQNIIHGDLKALNVLLTSSTRKTPWTHDSLPNVLAKVSDFGLSARLGTEQTHVSNVHSGTVTHMAPEVILAGQQSKASDVYAFGMLLYELFSGRRPFEGLNMQQVVHHVGTLGKRPVFPPGVPVQVVELACQCWGPAAGRPTFLELVDTLADLLKDFKRGLIANRRGTRLGAAGSDTSFDQIVAQQHPLSPPTPDGTQLGFSRSHDALEDAAVRPPVGGRSWGNVSWQGNAEPTDADPNNGTPGQQQACEGGRSLQRLSRTSDASSALAPSERNTPRGVNRPSRRPSGSSSNDAGFPCAEDNADIRSLQMQGNALLAGSRPTPVRRPSRRESRASQLETQQMSSSPPDIRALQLIGSSASASGPTGRGAPSNSKAEFVRRTTWADQQPGKNTTP